MMLIRRCVIKVINLPSQNIKQAMKYKVIKSKKQYFAYCEILESLLNADKRGAAICEEIELLTLLIEKWDESHNTFHNLDPVALLRALMNERGLKAGDLARILQVSKGLISDILNYKKGFSKDVIRELSVYFKVSQETFNRPYQLKLKKNKPVLA
jgi:HTH-type transcriptional regulator/antitoxin HigA